MAYIVSSGPATTARSAASQPSVVSLRKGGETCPAAAFPTQHQRRSASSSRGPSACHPHSDGCGSSSECMIAGSSDKHYWTSTIGCCGTSASRAKKPSVRPASRSGNDIALDEAAPAGGLVRPCPFPDRRQTTRRNPMKWITREHVKVDRVACPWL